MENTNTLNAAAESVEPEISTVEEPEHVVTERSAPETEIRFDTYFTSVRLPNAPSNFIYLYKHPDGKWRPQKPDPFVAKNVLSTNEDAQEHESDDEDGNTYEDADDDALISKFKDAYITEGFQAIMRSPSAPPEDTRSRSSSNNDSSAEAESSVDPEPDKTRNASIRESLSNLVATMQKRAVSGTDTPRTSTTREPAVDARGYCIGAELSLGIALRDITQWLRDLYEDTKNGCFYELYFSDLSIQETMRVRALLMLMRENHHVQLVTNGDYYCFEFDATSTTLELIWITETCTKSLVINFFS